MSITCQCGERMSCTDTRQSGPDVRRRYQCTCGKRATTKETIVEFDDAARQPGGQPRPHTKLAVNRKAPRGIAA